MRKLLLIGVALFGLVIGGHAQTPPAAECPTISVTAPAGIIQPPDPIWFIAEITGTVSKDIRYNWTVTKGSIIHGQGTSKIFTYPENENELNVTATVEVDGLPEGCYRVASETYVVVIDNFDPILMFEVSSSKLDVDLGLCAITTVLPRYNAIVTELEQNPTNQAYIIFSQRTNTSPDEAEACERGVIRFFTNAGIDRSRITSRRRTSEQVSVQFWRVPPGRENPRCEDCEKLGWHDKAPPCPTISVTGPAGVTQPGEPVDFTAEVSGKVPKGVRYRWTVSKGEIIEGQGTLEIKVRYDSDDGPNLSATLELFGMPDGCTTSVTETAPVCDCVHAILVDEFNISGLEIDKARLKVAAGELLNNPNNLLYFIEFYRSEVSEFDIREKRRRTSEYLVKEMNLSDTDFKFVTARADENRIRIYRIPPGAKFPVP